MVTEAINHTSHGFVSYGRKSPKSVQTDEKSGLLPTVSLILTESIKGVPQYDKRNEERHFIRKLKPTLNTYFADIDRQAQERFEWLIKNMKKTQGITEELREEKALQWTGRINNFKACAMEIAAEELIYT